MEPHFISDQAFDLLDRDKNGRYALDPPARRVLEELLRLVEINALEEAVEELLQLSWMLERKCDSQQAALVLIEVAESGLARIGARAERAPPLVLCTVCRTGIVRRPDCR